MNSAKRRLTMEKGVFFILSVILVFTTTQANTNDVVPDSIFKMTGYAAIGESTSGGNGGTIDTIDNLADLEAWALTREKSTKPETIYIKGKISSAESRAVTIKHGENISIIGIDSTSELEHVGLFIWDYKNVIVRNLKIHEVFYPEDALSISECQYVWVDHCELYSKIGAGIGIDTYDGLLDIKKGSKNVTVSWCYLHDHMKVCLIGHTDNETQGEIDTAMRITMHHNYFSNTDGRNPSLRFGAVHFFNNYCENIVDYGFAVRKRAHALIENNHYHNVRIPIATDKFDDVLADQGFACLAGNYYSGSCSELSNSITRTDCDFWNDLPYKYFAENASGVADRVIKYSGVGKIQDNTLNPSDTSGSITNSLGIQANETNNRISIFPNPSNGNFYITIISPLEGNVQIQLLDYSGRQLGDMGLQHLQKGFNQIPVTSTNQKPGLYLVTVAGNGFIFTDKLIIK